MSLRLNVILVSLILWSCSASKPTLEKVLKIDFKVESMWYNLMPGTNIEPKLFSNFNLSIENISGEPIENLSVENFQVWNEEKTKSYPLFIENSNALTNLSLNSEEVKKFNLKGEANPLVSAFLLSASKIKISFTVWDNHHLPFTFFSPNIKLQKAY
ncbi:MAG: hypothetical protein N3A61_01065 [Ignavibacteria bacterium]|nr:hypothetical protein [Ignavibacteria bacterium]